MPHYVFAVRMGNSDTAERSAELRDDAAALSYACEMVRELTRTGGSHPASVVEVRDETRPKVFSIPLLAACA